MSKLRLTGNRGHSYHYSQQRKQTGIKVLEATVLLIAVSVIGTLGYYTIEGWGIFDSFYMTVITLATVGYGETHDLSMAGRLFTVSLIIVSLGVVGYGVSNLAAFVVEGEFQRIIQDRKMDKRISKMKDHIILCGAGHNGKCVAAEFYKTQTPFVIIEKKPEYINAVFEIGDIPVIEGDAMQDSVLQLAGINRARGLVTSLSDDKDNTFVVLSARSLNLKLKIIARNIEVENTEKLRKAGADEVISPNSIGGLKMASSMIRPSVVQFLDVMLKDKSNAIRFDEVKANEIASFIGLSVKEADISNKTGLLLLAVMHEDGAYDFNPDANMIFKQNDILLVMGSPDQINRLKNV